MSGNVFTYNQFNGSPDQNEFGIPTSITHFQLPITVPTSPGAAAGGTSGNSALQTVHGAANAPLGYSAAGMEQFGPSPANASNTHATATQAPSPTLWATIAAALLGRAATPQVAGQTAQLVMGPGSVPSVSTSSDQRSTIRIGPVSSGIPPGIQA